MTFAQQQNCLTTHFSERIPIVKHRMTVLAKCLWDPLAEWRKYREVQVNRISELGQLKNPPATLPIWGLSDNLPI